MRRWLISCTVLHDAVFDSLGGSPGSLITDTLAAFLNNEEFATYLVESLYRLTYGVDYERGSSTGRWCRGFSPMSFGSYFSL